MNAQPEPTRAPPPLNDPKAWSDFVDPAGKPNPNVIISWCGRYTVVHYPPAGNLGEAFTAFRRHGPPAEPRWSPPTWCEAATSVLHAIELCHAHAEQEAAR